MFFLFLLLPIIKAQQPTVCGVPNFDIFTLNSGCLMAAMVNRQICAKNCANIQDVFTIYKNRFDNIWNNADCPETETAVTTFQTNAQFYIDKLNTTMTYDTTVNSLQINTTCALEHDGKIIEVLNGKIISVEENEPTQKPIAISLVIFIVTGAIAITAVFVGGCCSPKHNTTQHNTTQTSIKQTSIKQRTSLQPRTSLIWINEP
jgi:hypothetical protein